MKNRVLVIYKSKTGFTEQYARWICEALNGDRVSYEKRNSISWKDYDTIIYGGGFHAGQIGGLAWFKSRWPELEGKTKIVFATGATPAKAPAVEEALKQNFTDEEWNQVQVFYMQSG